MNAAAVSLLTHSNALRPAAGSLLWMAGPCAAESQEQVEACARFLAGLGVAYLRGGAFKPRTSPHAFQGLGLEGLRMLREAADRHELRVVSEVTDVRALAQAADLVDVVQVGARNMQNYDLLRECGRLRLPILLKRGLAATLAEWYSAADYIFAGGNEQIWLCERGHRSYLPHVRFMLDVAAIAEARRRGFLVIADPSHAAGRQELVAPLARAAVAAGAHGLLVEVHPQPAQALSDARQQLTFAQFRQLHEEIRLGP